MRRLLFLAPAVLLGAYFVIFPGLNLAAQTGQTGKTGQRSDNRQRDPRQAGQARPGGQPGRPGGRQGGPGRFSIPAPPVLTAIDTNKDGEISAEELSKASAALGKIDKNKDGELAGDELVPDFSALFGGRGGGRGGSRGGRFGGGQASTRKLKPTELAFKDGVAEILDHATYHKLSYRGDEVLIDTFLSGLEFVKFTYDGAATKAGQLYFINTKTHRAHMMFGRAAGLPRARGETQMKGVLVYRPMLQAPNETPGLFTFEFEPFDAYDHKMVAAAQTILIKKMPLLKGKIGYYPRGDRATAVYESQKNEFAKAGIKVYQDADLTNTEIAFLPLNRGTAFGRLRVMAFDERPSPRDIVLYKTLPNEMPRVAGIITAVRQTPLSHVNLRAIQDQIPNAFIADATTDAKVSPLIGKLVAYTVTPDGYQLRAASKEEVEKHFAAIRPAKSQKPQRDLTAKKIRKLKDIQFKDSVSVGVKSANLATLSSIGLAPQIVPTGHAIPFYFYDEFMKHNGLYEKAEKMLSSAAFKDSQDTRAKALKALRAEVRKAPMPTWMMSELADLQKSFGPGQSIRCRSSTNNEDLPGFSGAGLYDSFTHKPDEGHLAKSVKQVFASLWNLRAVEEREFYRVDHLATAMGVLVTRNFKGELANGVAVTDDILYQTDGNYYVNTQVGEDLVTNPDGASVPEEGLLDWWEAGKYKVMRTSNRAEDKRQLLTREQLNLLRSSLGKIHAQFAKLYGHGLQDQNFAMEVEFKITKEAKLVIKQARPWVYAKQNKASK